MATHDEVVQNFASQKINRHTKDVTWKGSRVDCRDGVIYSYGWWPMAYYLGQQNGEHLFLKRGDRYSVSTSGHQAAVQRYCQGPTVSFDALSAARVRAVCIGFDELIDWKADDRTYVTRKDGQYMLYGNPWTPPSQGMFVQTREHDDGSVSGYWHVLGGVCLQYDDRYLLCALDESTYFVAELPRKPMSVNHAFDILKPPAVIHAELEDLNVQRHGEWFFIPTDHTDRDITDMLGFKYLKDMREKAVVRELPYQDTGSNRHVCKYVDVHEQLYAKGMVRHVNTWGVSTRQHKALRLGDVWHEVHHNTEIASWSQSGRFD